MEIAELATSAGINIGLAILFFALYSVFRKQPANAGVYFARHLLRSSKAAAGEEKKDAFTLDSLVPSAGWVKRAWDATEADILKSSGVDAVVFLRIFILWWASLPFQLQNVQLHRKTFAIHATESESP